jgi:recombination protein RecA
MAAVVFNPRLTSLLAGPHSWQSRPEPEYVSTGIPEIDAATGGLPRGALTEIVGPASSGRTSLLHSILTGAAVRQEFCALVDTEDAFSPHDAGAALARLLWVRCAHNAEHALKATDLLIHGGGFGLVILDLGDTSPNTARRISLTSWFRLRRAVEHTPTVFVTLAQQPNARTCASLVIECGRARASWSGARGVSRLLRATEIHTRSTRRRKQCTPVFTATAI